MKFINLSENNIRMEYVMHGGADSWNVVHVRGGRGRGQPFTCTTSVHHLLLSTSQWPARKQRNNNDGNVSYRNILASLNIQESMMS